MDHLSTFTDKLLHDSSISRTTVAVSKTNCTEFDPHFIGMSIAEKFDVTYKEMVGWNCDDKTFEDILLALQTSQLSDKKPEELPAMLATQTWD